MRVLTTAFQRKEIVPEVFLKNATAGNSRKGITVFDSERFNFERNQSFSFATWVYIEDYYSNGSVIAQKWQSKLATGTTPAIFKGWKLFYNLHGMLILHFGDGSDVTLYNDAFPSGVLPKGRLSFVGFSYDGPTQKAFFIINGRRTVGRDTGFANLATSIKTSENFGLSWCPNPVNGDTQLQAMIGGQNNAMIFNRVLTETEWRKLWQANGLMLEGLKTACIGHFIYPPEGGNRMIDLAADYSSYKFKNQNWLTAAQTAFTSGWNSIYAEGVNTDCWSLDAANNLARFTRRTGDSFMYMHHTYTSGAGPVTGTYYKYAHEMLLRLSVEVVEAFDGEGLSFSFSTYDGFGGYDPVTKQAITHAAITAPGTYVRYFKRGGINPTSSVNTTRFLVIGGATTTTGAIKNLQISLEQEAYTKYPVHGETAGFTAAELQAITTDTAAHSIYTKRARPKKAPASSIVPPIVEFQRYYGTNAPFKGMPSNPSAFTIVSLYRTLDNNTGDLGYFDFYNFAGYLHGATNAVTLRSLHPADVNGSIALTMAPATTYHFATVYNGVNASTYVDGVLKRNYNFASPHVFSPNWRTFTPNKMSNGSYYSTTMMGYSVMIDQVLSQAQIQEIQADHTKLANYPLVCAFFGNDRVGTPGSTSHKPVDRTNAMDMDKALYIGESTTYGLAPAEISNLESDIITMAFAFTLDDLQGADRVYSLLGNNDLAAYSGDFCVVYFNGGILKADYRSDSGATSFNAARSTAVAALPGLNVFYAEFDNVAKRVRMWHFEKKIFDQAITNTNRFKFKRAGGAPLHLFNSWGKNTAATGTHELLAIWTRSLTHKERVQQVHLQQIKEPTNGLLKNCELYLLPGNASYNATTLKAEIPDYSGKNRTITLENYPDIHTLSIARDIRMLGHNRFWFHNFNNRAGYDFTRPDDLLSLTGEAQNIVQSLKLPSNLGFTGFGSSVANSTNPLILAASGSPILTPAGVVLDNGSQFIGVNNAYGNQLNVYEAKETHCWYDYIVVWHSFTTGRLYNLSFASPTTETGYRVSRVSLTATGIQLYTNAYTNGLPGYSSTLATYTTANLPAAPFISRVRLLYNYVPGRLAPDGTALNYAFNWFVYVNEVEVAKWENCSVLDSNTGLHTAQVLSQQNTFFKLGGNTLGTIKGFALLKEKTDLEVKYLINRFKKHYSINY